MGPAPPHFLSIGRSLAYCYRKLFYVCAQPAHRLLVKSAGGVGFFGPLQCRGGEEQILKSGLLEASAAVSPNTDVRPPLLFNGTPRAWKGFSIFRDIFLRSRQCHDARNASAVFKSAECRESPGRLHHNHPPDLRPQEAEGSRGSRRSVRTPGWSAAAQEALLRDQISLADSLQWENRWIAGGKQPVQ